MKTQINELIEKYWQGETSLDEEARLREYFSSGSVDEEHSDLVPLFGYFKHEAERSFEFEPDLSFTRRSSKGVRYLIPRIIAVAASILLLFSVSRIWLDPKEDTIYKNKYTELEDPEEALAITLDALGYVSHKIEEGTQDVKHMKKIEKTAVFNFDK